MEEDKSNGGRYRRAFGYSPPDNEDEDDEQDIEEYLRNLKRGKAADKEKNDEKYRPETDNLLTEESVGETGGPIYEAEAPLDSREAPERAEGKRDQTDGNGTSDGVELKSATGQTSYHEVIARKHSRIFGNRNLFRRGSLSEEDDEKEASGSHWLAIHYGRAFGKKIKRLEEKTEDHEEVAQTDDELSEDTAAQSGAGSFLGLSKKNTSKADEPEENDTSGKTSEQDREKGRLISKKRTTDKDNLSESSDSRAKEKEHSLYPPGTTTRSKNKGESRIEGDGAGQSSSEQDPDDPGLNRSIFKTKRKESDKAKEDPKKSSSAEKEESSYKGIFNIAGEELEAGKSFIKGKTRFMRTLGEEEKDGAELAVDALKESGRTVRQIITHIVTQVKNVIVVIVTALLGPVAGAIVSIIVHLLGMLLFVIVIVVLVFVGIITLVATLVTTFISFIVGLFVDEFNNTAEMYRYAYFYAVEYAETLEQEAAEYENVVIYRNDLVTTWDSFNINYEDAYLVYLGENQEAEYINVDLELAEGSVVGNLPELLTDTEENREAFKAAFAGLYYSEPSEDGSTLMIHVNTPFIYTMKHPQANMNVYYIVRAFSKNDDLRDEFGMMSELIEVPYPSEEE